MYFVLKWKLYKVEFRLLFNITLTLFTMCSANTPLKREHISNSESLCYHSNSLSLWNIYIMSNVFTMQQSCSKLYFLLILCVTFPLHPMKQSSRKHLASAKLAPCNSEKISWCVNLPGPAKSAFPITAETLRSKGLHLVLPANVQWAVYMPFHSQKCDISNR